MQHRYLDFITRVFSSWWCSTSLIRCNQVHFLGDIKKEPIFVHKKYDHRLHNMNIVHLLHILTSNCMDGTREGNMKNRSTNNYRKYISFLTKVVDGEWPATASNYQPMKIFKSNFSVFYKIPWLGITLEDTIYFFLQLRLRHSFPCYLSPDIA